MKYVTIILLATLVMITSGCNIEVRSPRVGSTTYLYERQYRTRYRTHYNTYSHGHYEYYNERIWVESMSSYAGEDRYGNSIITTTPGYWRTIQKKVWRSR